MKNIDKYTTHELSFTVRPTTPTARTDRLGLRICLGLLLPVNGLPFVVDEIRAVILEIV